MFAGEKDPTPVVAREGSNTVLGLPYGNVTLSHDADGNITAKHENGLLRITNAGRLVQADGVLCHAFVQADRPPPCPSCGSPHTIWLDFDDAEDAIEARAEELDRPVATNECDGKTLYLIEGYGGRAAACPCGAEVVYPTDPEFFQGDGAD